MNNTFQKTSPSTGNSLPTIALHNAVIDVKINIINEYVPIKNKVVLKLINIQNKIAITITIPNIIFPKCLYIFYLNYFFFLSTNIPHICHITKFKNNILNIKKFFMKIIYLFRLFFP